MEKYITCRYCQKKNRLACTFMRVEPHKHIMCQYCQTSARKGKKRVGTRWVGERKPVDKLAKSKYYKMYQMRRRHIENEHRIFI